MIRHITPEKPLRILGFTDTHIGDLSESNLWTLRLLRETVAAEQPDLVLFVGDNATGSIPCIEAFTACMTELAVPWCPVLGNHEGEHPTDTDRATTVSIFKRSPSCLLPAEKTKTADGRTLFGHTNYAVPLYNLRGEVCHKLIFLDGGNEMSAEDKRRFGLEDPPRFAYDFLKEEQIDWYKEEMQKDNCPSTVFCHIPLPEFRTAIEAGIPVLSGMKREGICSPLHNSGMFSAMQTTKKPAAYVCGHDHVNDFCILYDGVKLMYNRAGGLAAYNAVSKKLSDHSLLGCSVYTVTADGSITFSDLFYEDYFPQYRDTIRKVMRK